MLDAQEAALLKESAALKRQQSELRAARKARAAADRATEEQRLGKRAYAAGLASADTEVLDYEFALLAERLCGVKSVLVFVGQDGDALSEKEDANGI